MNRAGMATVFLGIFLACLGVAPAAQAGAKPLRVICQGGFFVKSPDKSIHWINADLSKKVEVYSQRNRLYALAQCDSGVISVFQKSVAGQDRYEAFYSPNCLNIGSENGKTQKVYTGNLRINKITPLNPGVEIRLEGNQYLRGRSCAAVEKHS